VLLHNAVVEFSPMTLRSLYLYEVYFRSPPGTAGPCVCRKSLYLSGDTACTCL